MLERFIVFTKTGVVLWSLSLGALHGDPVNSFIGNVLAPAHSGMTVYDVGDYQVKWSTANAVDLVFAAVISRSYAANVPYVDKLLELVKAAFVDRYGAEAIRGASDAQPFVDFNAEYDRLLSKAERQGTPGRPRGPGKGGGPGHGGGVKGRGRGPGPQGYDDDDLPELDDDVNAALSLPGAGSGKGAGSAVPPLSQGSSSTGPSSKAAPPLPGGSASSDSDGETGRSGNKSNNASYQSLTGSATKTGGAEPTAAEIAAKRAALMASRGVGSKGGSKRGMPLSGGKAAAPSPPVSSGKKGKEMAVSSAPFKYDEKLAATLQRGPSTKDAAGAAPVELVTDWNPDATGGDLIESDDEDEGTAGPKSSGTVSKALSWFSASPVGNFFKTITGNKILERSDLEPAIEALKNQLIGKNVASDVAVELCNAVAESLVGKRLEALSSVATLVQQSLRESIARILSARRPVELLAEIAAVKAAGKGPYTVAFLGVNGVGKSTSLAKVAHHCKAHGYKVRIAACDTFRAGAIEQLGVHASRLQIPLFKGGYGNDASVIAGQAIEEARREGSDVLLIDTAGRMQSNAPLMAQIAKLVADNQPNLVLFVGEALVGNDGVDQLVEFNKTLQSYTASSGERSIDGVVLTKFDTVDDKVGAALSMVRATGIPIAFLGVGQQYTDLRRLNVGAVVKALMS